ncbi:hypothetical protein KDA_60610 [Dictyobacter alpinus]|uniref:Uncharacterized protein n=1 Tax=Dictyobacter alpinus TaxID=2014873 RepID=A0A402BH56_9CHLR|nr:hypothetical protein [Dictyobacter alpinus]GCE30577.1 hypothetical protein KDA_60610 [Dictyobacter alpinus]
MPERDSSPQNANSHPQDAGKFDAARHMAERRIDKAIDQYARKIPGAKQFVGQAKKASSDVLDNLERQAESRLGGIKSGAGGIVSGAGDLLGGLFGKRKPKEPPPQ